MDFIEIISRLGLALFLGAIIGLERQWRQRMAGIRTNALVSAGAALFIMLAIMTPNDTSPTRVAAQIVTGIGFLGAGVIMRDGLNVRGLNTAATLWCVAAVGSLTGYGLYAHAVISAGIILAANIIFLPIERMFGNSIPYSPEHVPSECRFRLEIACSSERVSDTKALLIQFLNFEHLPVQLIETTKQTDSEVVVIAIETTGGFGKETVLSHIAGRLGLEPAILSVSWQIRGKDSCNLKHGTNHT